MNRRRYKRDNDTNASLKTCEMAGCANAGEYKAPKSVHNVRDYYWFCLDHVKEYNKQWDYFKGLGRDEIESYMHDAVTGHRPTWKREDHFTFTPEGLHSRLNDFLNGRSRFEKNPLEKPMPKKERDALADLDLDAPVSADELKKHYRKLVKLHHPDLHKGNKQKEDRFKAITASYKYLYALYSNASSA